MLFVGDDWAEAHHDVEIVDADGRRLAKRRLPEGVDALAGLHALVADHLGQDDDVADVVVGIETDRGTWVQARAHHRPAAGDSDIAEHVKVLARTHQSLIWSRQRQTNMLRSMLREFYPGAFEAFAEDLAGRDALAVLAIAPSPLAGRGLSKTRIAAAPAARPITRPCAPWPTASSASSTAA